MQHRHINNDTVVARHRGFTFVFRPESILNTQSFHSIKNLKSITMSVSDYRPFVSIRFLMVALCNRETIYIFML